MSSVSKLHSGHKETMVGPSRSYRCLLSAFTTPLCHSFPAPDRAPPQKSQQPTVTAGDLSPSQTCQSPCLQSPSLEEQEENPLYIQFILELGSEIHVMLCCLATGWERWSTGQVFSRAVLERSISSHSACLCVHIAEGRGA